MTGDGIGGGREPTLSPDDAFTVLGNGTRMEIVRTLGEAEGPLAFSELYDRVDVADSGQFSYHLDKLVGHFVRKTDAGYGLHQAGIRVVEAVLSGAITDRPVLEPTVAEDVPCPYCESPIEVSYREERLLVRCPDCPGEVRGGGSMEPSGDLPTGTIDLGYLPAAGLADRSPRELVEASSTWNVAERVAMSNGVCPRCSGIVDHSVEVCEDHTDGICEHCDRRHAVRVTSRCRTCHHEKGGMFQRLLLAEPAFRAFYDDRGIDLFAIPAEDSHYFLGYDEEVHSVEPFEARFSFTAGGDTLSMTVDDDLEVVDVTRDW